VQRVISAVATLKGFKDQSWFTCRSMMADPQFLKSLQQFDKDTITESIMKRVRSIVHGNNKLDEDSVKCVTVLTHCIVLLQLMTTLLLAQTDR